MDWPGLVRKGDKGGVKTSSVPCATRPSVFAVIVYLLPVLSLVFKYSCKALRRSLGIKCQWCTVVQIKLSLTQGEEEQRDI